MTVLNLNDAIVNPTKLRRDKNDTHFSRGHYLIGLFLVKVFYSLGENSRVGVGQVTHRFIAGII